MRSIAARISLTSVAALLATVGANPARAQGCEPIRFTTPVNLGDQGEAYQRGKEWRLTLAYRRLYSNEWYVGTAQDASKAPGGESPVFNIHPIVGDDAYAVSVGIGVTAPTGKNDVSSQFFTATGAVQFPADQTIQLGDGGWALLVQGQSFRQLGERVIGYAFGPYMANPKARSDVPFTPTSTVDRSVPDVYSTGVGGGDDNTIKRSSRILFAEPGVSLSSGGNTFTVSVPWRVSVNREKSLFEAATNGVNGGGFAKYLVFASYSRRL